MRLLQTLARETGLSLRAVGRIVASAPKRYKTYAIPKRNGGERIIAQPAFELKALQRLLMMRIFSDLPVHESAYAYVRGKSIRQNAVRHAQSSHILKLDFKDFFHSIRPVDLERVLRAVDRVQVNPLDHETMYQISFWGRGTNLPICLSIGAPSSPMISNIVMYELDRSIFELATSSGLIYTRYADDITVSSAAGLAPLVKFEHRLASLIDRSPLALTLNDAKRGIYGRGERRMVTGLIITPDGRVSIGRERKREIRAAVNRIKTGVADDRLLMRCKGMLAFVISAEPLFLRSLIRYYGNDVIRNILRTPPIKFYRDESLIELE